MSVNPGSVYTGNLQSLGSVGSPPSVASQKSVGLSPVGTTGVHYSTQVITGSAALTPPAPGMYLVNIRILTGVGPGVLKINYQTPNIACFPYNSMTTVAASGVSWMANIVDYPVNWKIDGTNIPAANVTVVGKAFTECELTYSTQPGQGPPISAYRGSTGATLTSSAASTVTNTITWDGGNNHAKAITFLVGWGSGTLTGTPDAFVQMPAVGPYQQSIYGYSVASSGGHLPGVPVEIMGDAPTLVLNMTTTSLGGATTLETIVIGWY